MGLIIGVGAVLVALTLWTIVAPRSQWRTLSAWRHRDVRAAEPSDAACTVARLGGVVVLAVVLVAGWQLIGLQRADRPVATATDAAAERHRVLGGEALIGAIPVAPDAAAAAEESAGGFEIPIRRYGVIDRAASRPAYLDGLGPIEADTDVMLLVNGAYRPAVAVLEQKPDRIIVTLRGGCQPPPAPASLCDEKTGASRAGTDWTPFILVPIALQTPLGGRAVIDGTTGQPVSSY